MAVPAQSLALSPVGSAGPGALERTDRALRSQRELRLGIGLASACAWALAMARLTDLASDGVATRLFGVAFLLTVLTSALLYPRWYLLFVVAYLPFSRVFPLILAAGANMTNFLLVLGPVAWLSSRARGQPPVRLGLTEPLVALFVAVASLSVVPTYSAGHALGDVALAYRAWLGPILLFFLARALVRTREDVAALLRVLTWTVFLVAACTWKEGIDRSSHGSIDHSRVRGLMEQANSMGAFLAYYGVPLLALAITARPWKRGWPYLATYLVAARATLYTFSRGAYAAFAAGSAAVLLGNPLLLAAAGGGGALAAAFFPSLIPASAMARLGETPVDLSADSLEDASSSLDRSSAMRLVLWHGAVGMIAEHPLQGVGLGRFAETVRLYTEQVLSEDDPADAHNAYLLLAAEAGIPSLILLLLLFLTWGFTAFRISFRRGFPIDRRLGLAFLGSLVSVFVSCMVGSRFSDDALIGYFWILAAMVVVVGRLREPRRRPARAA